MAVKVFVDSASGWIAVWETEYRPLLGKPCRKLRVTSANYSPDFLKTQRFRSLDVGGCLLSVECPNETQDARIRLPNEYIDGRDKDISQELGIKEIPSHAIQQQPLQEDQASQGAAADVGNIPINTMPALGVIPNTATQLTHTTQPPAVYTSSGQHNGNTGPRFVDPHYYDWNPPESVPTGITGYPPAQPTSPQQHTSSDGQYSNTPTAYGDLEYGDSEYSYTTGAEASTPAVAARGYETQQRGGRIIYRLARPGPQPQGESSREERPQQSGQQYERQSEQPYNPTAHAHGSFAPVAAARYQAIRPAQRRQDQQPSHQQQDHNVMAHGSTATSAGRRHQSSRSERRGRSEGHVITEGSSVKRSHHHHRRRRHHD
jgi:hypothetical protein